MEENFRDKHTQLVAKVDTGLTKHSANDISNILYGKTMENIRKKKWISKWLWKSVKELSEFGLCGKKW